ncbi:maestro heat-like repeat-containing protein family member 1 isoform X2 [Ambystoma mexicanum]|uniref:maestro heat-like repeat-containing protein family member 1 isoform X2 n=1 Tax=Ambystoma mexicanum TaxID=8296 RepID=UPI0037E87545
MAVSSVKRLTVTLIEASTDRDADVQEQIYNSLCFMGEAEPEEVLLSCVDYLKKNDKLGHLHRTVILRALEMVVKNNLAGLEMSTAKAVISLASAEMTKTKDIIYDWQNAASCVLVAVGRRFINNVMEEILTKFQPGVLPHFFIMQTLASLSTANVFGMVPFLNSILGTMLPMLGMAKQDHMKAVFCVALQHFSESIQEYLANLDKAPDPTVRKDTFSNEIFSAYDILFNSWLQNRETKVRLAVVEAVGPMTQLMPNEKLEEQLPRLIPGILSLYKKSIDAFYVTKSLCQILEASVSMCSRTLETQMEPLLLALYPQICVSSDPSLHLIVKNQTEVLRCFSVLACAFPDRLLAYVLPKLENNNEKIRLGTLVIMKQIINSASVQMESKKSLILASMKLPLQDSSNKVKRAVVQVISAMAHHGYLEQTGGEMMVEYIVRLCALSPEALQIKRQNSDSDDVTGENVRRISISTLYLISTTIDRMSNVLWPYLLEFVIPAQFTNALTPVCKSLTQLAMKKQEAGVETLLINYEMNVNLPSPHALTTRLLVVSSCPYLGDGRGTAALRLLGVMQPNIHPAVSQIWEKEIPSLLNYLEDNTEKSLVQKEWEDKLLQFLGDSLNAVSDDSWICQLAQEMGKRLPCYNCLFVEKNFLYKCIGTVLRISSNKDMVTKQLQELLATARYQEEAEREGLATGFGICSVSHLDITLLKLEDFLKSDVLKKYMGLFNIFKDRNENDLEKIKSSLILCYGYVAMYAPKELVLSRIESDILRSIFLYFNSKDLTLKLCLIRSICMIAMAICNSNQCSFFNFSRKSELIAQMMEFIKSEPLESMKTPLRQRAIICCTYLVKLEPPLSDQERFELINTSVNWVFALPPSEILKEKGGSLNNISKEVLYHDTLDALKELLKSILHWHLTPNGLQEMFQHFGVWIKSTKEHERERAVDVSAALLEFFLKKLNVNTVVPFYNLGLLIGRLSSRCSDSHPSIRKRTVDCIYYLLYIQLRYEGFAQDYVDELVENLIPLKEGLEKPDSTVLFHTCFNIAMIIGKRLPPEQLTNLLFITFEGLSDPDSNCSRAATVMINSLLKDRGTVLLEKVPEIIVRIHDELQKSTEEHVKKAAVQTVFILASQHMTAVVCSLLASCLPYDSDTCVLWKALATETVLTTRVLDLLLEKLNGDVPYKESKTSLLSSSSGRIATVQPLAATCALHEILSVPESSPAVLSLYQQLFVNLLLRVSCTIGVQLPRHLNNPKEKRTASPCPIPRNLDPCSSAVETMKAMLTQGGSYIVVKDVERNGGWELMKSSDTHHDGVAVLASAMANQAGPKLPVIVKNLVPAISSLNECQRITTTAFFAELLNHNVVNDLNLFESIMDNLTGRQKDSCVTVRMLAVRGLGNIASGSPAQVSKNGPQLLTSLINAMDDKDDSNNLVTLEAKSSLSKILYFVNESDIRSVLIHIAIRIRPFFDNEKAELRQASIILFGKLTKFSNSNNEDVFFEQILNGLVTLLLHLQDPKPEVVKACKFALRMCAPNMGCDGLGDMFKNHLHENRGLHYGEFMNDVCKNLMQEYPDMLNRLIVTNLSYFKSIWADIRAAAPMFIGFLVLHMQKEHCKQVDLDHLVSSLTVLLKDPIPAVRIKAAETLGRLVKFT